MSGRGGTFAAVLATLVTFVAIDVTVPVLGAALFLSAWGCSDGGGCHGILAP